MIGVGIVVYNPDYQQLEKAIQVLAWQDCEILLIDNSEKGEKHLEYIEEKNRCTVIYNKKNCGVAKAYNQIMHFFSDRGIEYVLTLDQDSVCPENIVEEYIKYTHIPDVGIICPVLDYKGDDKGVEQNQEYKYVSACISSGSLISIDCWKNCNGFDEDFFIDFVDFDFCYSIREKGYKIIQIQMVHLDHELGNLTVKYIFGKKIMVTNHSPLRKYYFIRNAIICHKKHKKMYGLANLLRDIVNNYLKTLLYEENKIDRIKMMNKGVINGIRKRCVNI